MLDKLKRAANLPPVNTSTTNNNAARDAGQGTQITARDRTAHIGLLATPAHTPEPWHFISDRIYRTTPAEHIYIAETQPTGRGNATEMISNARRIIACVNACAGMTDPAVEIAALRGAQDEALGLRIALVDAQKQIASLRAERTAYQTAARAWKDEVTALRAALEPFAELATSAKCDEMPEHAARTFVITAASMLAARKALAGKGDK